MGAVHASPSSHFRRSPAAAAVAMAFAPFASHALTYTVINTADSGAGSLRDAMTLANGSCAVDPAPVINFAIPGTGPFTIAPASPLPTMNCASNAYSVQIDATTQGGYVANSSATGFNGVFGVILDGSAMSSPGCGLHYNDPGFYGGTLTIRGLDVKNFAYAGIGQALCGILRLYGNRVQGSDSAVNIGSAVSPAAIGSTSTVADRNVIANNSVGISVSYGGAVFILNNLIGTPDGVSAPTLAQNPGISWGGAPTGSSISQNVISGNVVGLNFSSDNGAIISNNKFGTNAAGTAAIPNATGLSGASLNGTDINNNLFSGNTGNGVALQNVQAVSFTQNLVGLNATGTAAIANGSDGMFVQCGSTMTLSSNIFSGNVANGITLAGVDAVQFTSNKVGTTGGGAALANGDTGLMLAAGACAQYGSNGLFAFNTIAHNGVDGIALTSPFGVGNQISQGSIFANGNKNININNTVGPLPNDAGDADTGPNNQQNYPVISLVTQSGGNTFVTWSFNSAASQPYQLQFFSNSAAGTPAGENFQMQLGISTDAAGNASTTTTIPGLVDFISVTARDGTTNDTSEFSPIVAVTPTPAVTVNPTALAFGNVVVNTTSPPQGSTLTSSGTANYAITTFDTSALCYGAPLCYGGPFICSSNCNFSPSSYAPAAACTVTASFAPIALGPQSSTIYICDNATGSPHTITLSGTGVTAPPVQVSPATFDFGSFPVGATSPAVVFNFANPGSSPVPISNPGTTGPFQVIGTNCGASIPGLSSCNASVTFTPAAPGLASGTVFVTSAATPVAAGLAGTGINAPLVILPPPIDLGSAILGVSGPTETITLTNTGNATLIFSAISVSAPFTLTNNCPANLAPGASCDLVVGVDSSSPGSYSGTLTVVSNGGSGTVALSAIVQPIPVALLKVSPTQVGFGDRIAGTPSATQQIAITNEGGEPAHITGLDISADFVVASSTCGASLAPSSTCFVSVAMKAVGFGRRVGRLVVDADASNAPLTVSLSGTGCRPYSAVGNRGGARSSCSP